MKKKNIIIYMIAAIMSLMVIFSGCGNSSNDKEMSYEDIIAVYAELVDSIDYMGDYMEEADINIELLDTLAGSDEWNIYYTLKDVDNNGIDELLISGGYDTDEIVNYLIYTMSDKYAVELFEDYEFGGRVHFTVYEGGIIGVNGSNSAEDAFYEYYEIDGENSSVKLIESNSAEDGDKYSKLDEMKFDWKKL